MSDYVLQVNQYSVPGAKRKYTSMASIACPRQIAVETSPSKLLC